MARRAEDEFFPWERQQWLTEGVRQELLPPVRRESSAVHHIMVSIYVLNGGAPNDDAPQNRHNPKVAQVQQARVDEDQNALEEKDASQEAPHVHAPLRGDLCVAPIAPLAP